MTEQQLTSLPDTNIYTTWTVSDWLTNQHLLSDVMYNSVRSLRVLKGALKHVQDPNMAVEIYPLLKHSVPLEQWLKTWDMFCASSQDTKELSLIASLYDPSQHNTLRTIAFAKNNPYALAALQEVAPLSIRDYITRHHDDMRLSWYQKSFGILSRVFPEEGLTLLATCSSYRAHTYLKTVLKYDSDGLTRLLEQNVHSQDISNALCVLGYKNPTLIHPELPAPSTTLLHCLDDKELDSIYQTREPSVKAQLWLSGEYKLPDSFIDIPEVPLPVIEELNRV